MGGGGGGPTASGGGPTASGGGPTASGGGGRSSSDDDGDASWKAAIESIASVGFGVPLSNGTAKSTSGSGGGGVEDYHGLEPPPQEGKAQTPGLKLYQIKVRNMLDDMLEKNLEIVKTPCVNLAEPMETDGGIKLFKKAPPGIRMDSMDKHHVQLKRPRILPGPEVDEKSKKFRHMLQSVIVDGNDILLSAREASQRSLARLKARETAAKATTKRDEERVRELKKVRGEKWLPSISRQMKEEKAWEQRQ